MRQNCHRWRYTNVAEAKVHEMYGSRSTEGNTIVETEIVEADGEWGCITDVKLVCNYSAGNIHHWRRHCRDKQRFTAINGEDNCDAFKVSRHTWMKTLRVLPVQNKVLQKGTFIEGFVFPIWRNNRAFWSSQADKKLQNMVYEAISDLLSDTASSSEELDQVKTHRKRKQKSGNRRTMCRRQVTEIDMFGNGQPTQTQIDKFDKIAVFCNPENLMSQAAHWHHELSIQRWM